MEAHMILREKLVKDKLAEVDAKQHKLLAAKAASQREADVLLQVRHLVFSLSLLMDSLVCVHACPVPCLQHVETAMKDIEAKQGEIVQREQRLIGMLPEAAAPGDKDAVSTRRKSISTHGSLVSGQSAPSASKLSKQLGGWKTSVVAQDSSLSRSQRGKGQVAPGSVSATKSTHPPARQRSQSSASRVSGRGPEVQPSAAGQGVPAAPQVCLFCGSLGHVVAIDVPAVPGHRTVLCPWLESGSTDATTSLEDITDDNGVSIPARWLAWVKENVTLGVGKDVILAILACHCHVRPTG
jgi:hypothetical protein